MSDFRSERTLGERIKSLRRQRGIRSTNELANLTEGAVSAWTLQNLESGRKQDLNVSSLLNLAMALKVAPGLLLAPMARPDHRLDLPGLTEAFTEMTTGEFDAWFSGLPEGATRTASGEDRNERIELQAFRELVSLARERRRLRTMLVLESEAASTDALGQVLAGNTKGRLDDIERHIAELSGFLRKAGWELGDWASGHG